MAVEVRKEMGGWLFVEVRMGEGRGKLGVASGCLPEVLLG